MPNSGADKAEHFLKKTQQNNTSRVFRSAAARELAPAARGDGPAGRGPELDVLARLRHRAPLIPATFDGEVLKFENEIKRPASGQSAVLYIGDECIGGGIIT